jgi:hypothetical protein
MTTKYAVTGRTSQETLLLRYRTKPVMLRKFCGFDGGDYKEFRLLGCEAVWLL